MLYEASKISFKIANQRDDHHILVLIEKTTDVIYLQMQHGYNMGGLTPMLDPETGLPLTFKVWNEKYNK